LLPVIGCRDKELTKMQAEVNRAATELVRQDTEARREWMVIQSGLDTERRRLATQGRRDPIIAQAILQIGGIGLCLLPLWVIVRLLRRDVADPVLQPIDELTMDELLSQGELLSQRSLLPGPDHPHPPGNEPGPTPRPTPGNRLVAPDLDTLIDARLRRRGE
jgi:hypothetical protein